MLQIKGLCAGLGICFIFYSAAALADHPTIAFGSEGAGAINTISAKPLPVGTWGFGLRSEYISNDEFSTEQLESFAGSGLEGVHSIDSIRNTSFSLAYGVTENFSISARLPYIERDNIREGELEGGVPEAHTHGDSEGMGDLLLFGQYRILKQADLDISVLFGIKSPTGETDERDDDGIRFETEFQPSTGSWDFLLGASASKSHDGFGYHANILFNKTTKGSQSTEIGDVVFYNAALTYRLNDNHAEHNHSHHHHASDSNGLKWDVSVELNGESRRKNRMFGASDGNSGGTTIYFSPGFRVSLENFSGFISYGIPFVQDQSGKQTEVDSRIVAGISVAI